MNYAKVAIIVFVILCFSLAAAFIFHIATSRDVSLKRRVWRNANIGAGIVFVAVCGVGLGWPGLLFAIPGALLVAGLNIERTKFCDSCGATLYRWNGFSRDKFCAKCGSKLP